MSSILSNFVRFTEGVPKRLHFTDHALVNKPIADPVTGLIRAVTTLDLVVDEEDFAKVAKVLSVTADKLAAQLEPYLNGKTYRGYDFIVTLRGVSFSRRYSVEVLPRPA